jgi:6-phosphogluconolactonase (cycloisomerase 2 family)
MIKRMVAPVAQAALCCAVVSLGACTGGVSSTDTSDSVTASQFSVGGTVSGLRGAGLILQNNGGDDLPVRADGTFTFATPLVRGDSYSISILTQPSTPTQTCVVSDATGTVGTSNVTSIAVSCVDKTTITDTIGGTATGVLGSGLVLQDNNGDNLAVASNGPFTFATALASGAAYTVSVLTPPINPYQNCVVTNGTGTTGTADVDNVAVSCTTNSNPAYTIGGTITGVSGTGTVVLQDNGRDNLTASADGAFTFALPIPSGSTYDVTSLQVKGQQSQTCTFTNASGTVAASNVTNVSVVCKANAIVSLTVSGLTGTGLVLQDNGSDNLAVTTNGPASFATAIASGSTYRVTVLTPPSNPSQNCIVSNGSGIAIAGTPTAVTVACTTVGYTVGGTVSGLSGAGLVLQDNGANNLAITANGAFVFPAPIASGGTYAVTVSTQPTAPSQTCTVNGDTGTISSGNVTTVTITCTTNSFTVGGTVSGLNANAPQVVLQDNGGANLTVTANGTFAFPAQLSGTPYAVTVLTAPSGHYCAVAAPTGTVTNADVTNVAVTCVEIGAFAYVTNSGDNTVTGYVVDFNSGALLPLPAPVASGAQPSSIVDGCYVNDNTLGTLYVANAGSASVSAYSVDLNSGLFSLITNPPTTAGTTPAFVAFNSYLCEAFVVNNGANTTSAYLTDPTSGALTETTGSPFSTAGTGPVGATNLNSSVESNFATEYVVNSGSNSIQGYSVDATTGALAAISTPVATGTSPSAVIQTQIGEPSLPFIYVTNQGSNSISQFSENQTTGVLTAISDPATGTPLPPVATGQGPTAITLVPVSIDNFYVYVANGLDGTVSVYSYDALSALAEGALTNVATVAVGSNPVSLTYGNVGGQTYLYVVNGASNDVSVFSIDLTTGALTAVAGSPFATGTTPTSGVFLPFPPG